VTKITGSTSNDCIYWQFGYNLSYNQYGAIADIHNLQFTVTHKLGFSVSTNRLLATDLNTETSTSNRYEVFLPFLVQSPRKLGTELKLFWTLLAESQSQSQSYVTTDGQLASLSWNKAHIWGLRTYLYYCQTVSGLLM
jgi:hypothetical protein